MLISLTTDFGLEDGYVGTMRGIIAGLAPGVPLIDLTHAIAPQDVRQAAYILWTALPYFPSGSVHLVVVDPGVGTERRPLAARTAWGILVGPDNGVFSYVWAEAPPLEIVELRDPDYRRARVSHTFHGRDIFAPAAAHLALGVPLAALGPLLSDPVRLPLPALESGSDAVRGEALHVDRFGNVITSIGRLEWERGALLRLQPAWGGATTSRILDADRVRVFAGGRDLGPIRRTYGEVEPGTPLALVGSEGMLELAVNRGRGVDVLSLSRGDPVVVRLSP